MIKATIRHSDRFDGGWTTARLTLQVTFASPPPTAPRANVTAQVHARSEPEPQDTKAQTLVIGANVVSFQAGFTARERQDIVDCLVLARLAATAKVKSPSSLPDALSWFNEFDDTLSNLGFRYVERGVPTLPTPRRTIDMVEVMHRVGRDVADAEIQRWLLAGVGALRQIGAVSSNSALGRIVRDDSRRGRVVTVQTTVAGRDSHGRVKLVAIVMLVESTTAGNALSAQFDRARRQFDAQYAVLDVDMQMLQATRDAIAKRLDPLRPQIERYVRSFPDPTDMEASEE